MKTSYHPRFRPSLFGRAIVLILGLCLAFTAAHAQVVPPPGLVSWWPGESNGRDMQGANDGGAFGAGKVGRAFQLDGARGYVRTADSPSWDFGTNDFTLDGWIYTATPVVTTRLISAGATPDGPNNLWTFGYGGNQLNFAYWNGSGFVDFYSTPITIPKNTWHHIAVVRAGSTLSFYFDGAAVGAPTIGSVAINGGSTGVILGARYRANASTIIEVANGRIDEVDMFSRALSPSEIQANYNAGAAGKLVTPPGADLMAWWRSQNDGRIYKAPIASTLHSISNLHGTSSTPSSHL